MAKRSSFLSRLTGNDDSYFDDEFSPGGTPAVFHGDGGERHAHLPTANEKWPKQDDAAGELAVDVYQTPEAIVIKALIAGVHPNSIDISLTRETVTVSGARSDEREVEEDNYFQRELYWGSFSRTILLPEEIDVDLAEASEKHGVLMLRLPKINKKRETKLKVRAR
ncbi:MAG TPA: Hsp20/alpha crystallin family protein [Candidatus Paceibacterota bacterium]